MDDGIRLLEEKHVIHILGFIGDNPGCMKTEIYSAVSHNPRMPDKLKMLADAGLVIAVVSEHCTRYTLSDVGMHVKDLVSEIMATLEHGHPASYTI